MKQFKNLEVTGPDEQLSILIETVSSELPTGWRCDEDGPCSFSFTPDTEGDLPPARLYLERESCKLYLSNIVPRDLDHGGLSICQYNAILDEFVKTIRKHQPSGIQLEIKVTSDEADIARWRSSDAASLLNNFSTLANKSTGGSDSSDFKRWARFLIRAHRERFALDNSFLSRWLVEELGWPEDRADDLARKYEFARDLLTAYDES